MDISRSSYLFAPIFILLFDAGIQFYIHRIECEHNRLRHKFKGFLLLFYIIIQYMIGISSL